MGLFTKLGQAWSEWSTLPKAWDSLGDSWKAIKSAPKTFASGALNLATAVRDRHWGAAWNAYTSTVMKQSQIATKPLEALSNVPIGHQLFGSLLWAQNELVKRPAATANLAFADQVLGKGSILDGETWRKAYNTTQHVTVGQSGTYSQAAWQEWAGLLDRGVAASFDPRDREVRERVYLGDTPFKYTSGAIDTAVTLVADPTVAGISGGLALKSKYLSQPMHASAIAAGKPAAYVNTARYNRVREFARDAETPEALRQRVFAGHVGGDKAAAMLWQTRHDDKLFNLTFRSLYADTEAFDELVSNAPRLADVVGSTNAANGLGRIVSGQGVSSEATAAAQALKAARAQAYVDDLVNGQGLWGLANPMETGGLLAGQNLPRMSLSSAWRTGAHNTVTFGPTTWRGGAIGKITTPVASRLRYALPSARFSRYLDLTDVNGTAAFRANLERAPLGQADLEHWVSQYGRATTPEQRFQVAAAAEDAGWVALADKHNMSVEAARRLLPQINRYRTSARQIANNSRQSISTEAQKLADKYIESGRAGDAYRVNQAAGDLDAAVARGEQPTSVMHVLDEDGNSALLPEGFHEAGSRGPVLMGAPDYMPMADFTGLDKGLFWHSRTPGLARVVDSATALADTAFQFWKTAALLRPGYIPRTLSDDGLRRQFTVGSAQVLQSSTIGAVNAATNMVRRGRAAWDRLASTTQRAPRPVHQVDVTHTSPVTDSLVDEIPGVGTSYASHERAMATGAIDPDAYISASENAFRAGADMPNDLRILIQGRRDGTIGRRAYRNQMIDRALNTVGRDAYAQPYWQRAFVDTITDMHAAKPGTQAVVDPYTGATPSRVQPGDFALSNSATVQASSRGRYNLDAVYDYIAANHSDLLAPNNLLHVRITNGGKLKLSVGTLTGEGAEAIKASGGRRYSFAGHEFNYATQGMKPITLTDRATGESRTLEAAFEGSSGARFQESASSAAGGSLWFETQANRHLERGLAQSGKGWQDVTPGQANYAESWQAAVNEHMGADPVARQFMEGRSEDAVLAWAEQTAQGRAWRAQLGPQQARYVDHVRTVRAMVDTYLPHAGDDASAALRAKALAGSATIDDLRAVVAEEHNLPMVHGMAMDTTFGGPVSRLYNKAVDKAFQGLANLPADKLVRFPFASERYNLHLRNLYDGLSADLAKRGDSIPHSVLPKLSNRARQLALADVKKYLYDSTAVFDLAQATRFLVPFSNAIGDAFTKWGVIIREQGGIPAAHIMKAWTAPDRNGLVYDEDGNWKHLDPDSGVVTWYQLNPDGTKTELPGHKPLQEYMAFQLPSWVKPDSVKGNVLSYWNKDTFNTMLNVPTAGPVVGIPANYFALKNPELAADRWVRRWILPFGPSSDYTRMVVPSNAVNTYDYAKSWFTDRQEENRNLAAAVWQTEATNHALGKRADMPTIDEANEGAAGLMNLRFWAQWGLGYTTQFHTVYQHQVDVYRHMLAETGSVNDATAQFLEEMGPEYQALTMSVTRNNAGLPATVGTQRATQRYKDLIAKFPDLAPLIVGAEGAGAYNQAVYENQLATPMADGSGRMMREVMTLQESIADNQKRQTWVEWNRLDDAITAEMARRGLRTLTQKGAADLRAARQKFVNANKTWTSPQGVTELSPWYVEHSTTDQSKMQGRLLGMQQILADPQLADRDDMRGLAQYLDMRARTRAIMGARRLKTLDSAKAQSLRNRWLGAVFDLKERNLSFSSLHSRWLYSDDVSFDIPQGEVK